MANTKKDFRFLPFALAILGVLAIVIFLVFPVAYNNDGSSNIGGINGLSSVFGMDVSIGSINLKFRPVNGVGLTILILTLVASVCSGFLAKYGRGFYIFSTVLLLTAVIFTCLYHTSWIYSNMGGQTNRVYGLQCGAGQVIAAALMILEGIGNIVAFRLLK